MKHRSYLLAFLGLAAGLLGLSPVACLAADSRPRAETPFAYAPTYFLHLGASAVPYDESSVTTLGGAPFAGADIRLDTDYTLAVELGYFFTPNFAVALSGGYPPTKTAWGAGTAAGLGALGKVTGGIMELNGQYHITDFGAFQPYVGAGPAYLHVFGTKDGSLTSFAVNDAVGFNFQIGADWMMNDKLGLFVDLKKVFLATTATGFSGPTAVNTSIHLDPTVISAGLTLHY